MSGHSKWATTKRQKAVVDAKRGAIFTKMSNLITIAARDKGGDPATNFTLRMAIDKARQANMPKDNIERAIKRGTGEGGGNQIEELVYEGQGPVGSQFIIKCVTDSRNRTASTIRHAFSKAGGSLGSVMWNFSLKGVVQITTEALATKNNDWDSFELELIDQGVEEIIREEEGVTLYTAPEDLQKLKSFLEQQNIATETAEIQHVAKDKMTIEDADDRLKMEKFIDSLEDCEDVSDYYTNAEWE
ncbi:MAG TPA: YebC/PmpR family DNA-binding transcriptional regulator [bacterium]|nr:YebC/PmpR family DNA-binding transcriptional regulator [bacterium]